MYLRCIVRLRLIPDERLIAGPDLRHLLVELEFLLVLGMKGGPGYGGRGKTRYEGLASWLHSSSCSTWVPLGNGYHLGSGYHMGSGNFISSHPI